MASSLSLFPSCAASARGARWPRIFSWSLARPSTPPPVLQSGQVLLRGFSSPMPLQQMLIQYADDSTFTIFGTQSSVSCVKKLLANFGNASGLISNLQKIIVFWFGKGPTPPPPPWIHTFRCPVVAERVMLKLLDMPFGLSVNVANIDAFLLGKNERKLQYWTE